MRANVKFSGEDEREFHPTSDINWFDEGKDNAQGQGPAPGEAKSKTGIHWAEEAATTRRLSHLNLFRRDVAIADAPEPFPFAPPPHRKHVRGPPSALESIATACQTETRTNRHPGRPARKDSLRRNGAGPGFFLLARPQELFPPIRTCFCRNKTT